MKNLKENENFNLIFTNYINGKLSIENFIEKIQDEEVVIIDCIQWVKELLNKEDIRKLLTDKQYELNQYQNFTNDLFDLIRSKLLIEFVN